MKKPIAEACLYDPQTRKCKPLSFPLLAHEIAALLPDMELVEPITNLPPYTHITRVRRQYYLVRLNGGKGL